MWWNSSITKDLGYLVDLVFADSIANCFKNRYNFHDGGRMVWCRHGGANRVSQGAGEKVSIYIFIESGFIESKFEWKKVSVCNHTKSSNPHPCWYNTGPKYNYQYISTPPVMEECTDRRQKWYFLLFADCFWQYYELDNGITMRQAVRLVDPGT